MSTPDDFDRTLSTWLDERAHPRAPDRLLREVVARTAATRPRRAWRILERWIPMTVTLRLAVVQRALLLLLLLGVLLAAAAAGIALGQRLPMLQAVTPLAPTGPAGNGLIAFGSAGDVWVVRPDGTDLRQLTTSPALEHTPVWSRDGTRIAYWSQDTPTAPSSLIVADADGSDALAIATDAAGRTPWSMDWSPDGSAIAYSLSTDALPDEERIFTAQTDGGGTTQVGDPALNAWKPEWSPDGTSIAFSANRAGLDQGVYLMAPDGSDVRRLSVVDDADQYAFFTLDWAPDGSAIVTNAQSGIWRIASDGSGEAMLADEASDLLVPVWSPAGDEVSFINVQAGLRVLPTAGGETRGGFASFDAGYVWSPDGTAFATLSGARISILDALTGAELARAPAPDQTWPDFTHYPSWQLVALP